MGEKIIVMKAADEKSKHLCLSIMPSNSHVGIDNIDLVTFCICRMKLMMSDQNNKEQSDYEELIQLAIAGLVKNCNSSDQVLNL